MSNETGPGGENRMGGQPSGQFGGDSGESEENGMHAEGALPFGWYYFGPEPPTFQPPGNPGYGPGGAPGTMHGASFGPAGDPYGAAPGAHGGDAYEKHDKSAAYMDAFDRLSRGHVDAQTIGKLLSLDDEEFWKGALVGAGAALLATNLPALKTMLAGAFAGGGAAKGGESKSGDTDAAKHASEADVRGGSYADDKETKE
ncbi:hypothetical protein AUC70_06135 [Methyloceanibacter stevinii]|uniref:Uncharacterized protein n=1 Tax=Methyloceanibacter stevinii TaxID=1774970 RepID=A0A1E3VQN0_9HYPH|nr:hypothetical protein [Methyloceanibacter stevinii]ODR95266.1 hypothetical protein AUC70_06135 [Methyloceanibacter stevinii]